MLALKLRGGQFVFAGHTGAVATGNGRGAVRGAAGNFINPHLPLKRVRQADNNKTMVKKGDVK